MQFGPHQEANKGPHDLLWAAGFLEGEGSFSVRDGKGRACISCSQKHKPPLKTLKDVFDCGKLFWRDRPSQKNGIWEWKVYTAEDIYRIATKLRPLMHPRRQAQIDKVLSSVTKTLATKDAWLKDHEIRDIYRRVHSGNTTGKQLAKEYGVSTSLVSQIKRGKWKSEVTSYLNQP